MIIAIGAKNEFEVEALKRTLLKYDQFVEAIVEGVDVNSGVPSQPSNKRELYLGADNRASRSFASVKGCYLGFGLESGLEVIPGENLPRLNTTLCSLYDGQAFYHGIGGAFALPMPAAALIQREKIEMDKALFRLGYTRHPDVGKTQGGYVAELTGGRVTRSMLFEMAINLALAEYNLKSKR